VLGVAWASAILGDNLGYWLGRRHGPAVIARYGHWAHITPRRLDKMSGLVSRYGAYAVFAARFVPGLRFLAGPVAGIVGLAPFKFVVANVLGALLYVPYAVGIGYGLGYGFGDHVERLIGRVEWIALPVAGGLILGFVVVRIVRARHAASAEHEGGEKISPPVDHE
jgi:membrane protein DedA with SNARE-associated domain